MGCCRRASWTRTMSRRPLRRLINQVMGTSQDSTRPVMLPDVKGGLRLSISSRKEWGVIHWIAWRPPSGSSARLDQMARLRPRRRMSSLPATNQTMKIAPTTITAGTAHLVRGGGDRGEGSGGGEDAVGEPGEQKGGR